MITYRNLSLATSAVGTALFVVLLLYPTAIYWLFDVAENDSANFMLRRTSLLFAGLAVTAWLSRNALNSDSRQAICTGLSFSLLALAALGMLEHFSNAAGRGIWVAIVVEVVLGIGYAIVALRNRTL